MGWRRRASPTLGGLAKATGEAVRVRAILTLPGWYVKSRVNTELKVMSPKQIRRFVREAGPAVLAGAQIQRIAHQLEQRCRDVEL